MATLRQHINNSSPCRKINRTEIGRTFQESKIARGIEAIICTVSDGFACANEEGKGFLTGMAYATGMILFPNFHAGYIIPIIAEDRLLSVRPDLNGEMTPKEYSSRLAERGYGRKKETPQPKLRIVR